jgi:predicted metal-dependent hydrolase
MRKRSKTEIEIRNILSETLLHSLRSGTKSDNLNVINKYCGKASNRAIDGIYLKDLVEKKTSLDRAGIYWKRISDDVLLKKLFASGPGDSIVLQGKFAKYQTFICRKTKAYLKLISRLNNRSERLNDKLESKVIVGVMLFNNGFFFECHEYLEEIWLKERGRAKSFLKGFIHTCVAFYHFEYQNIKGTVNYLKRSSGRLIEFQPNFLGVDVGNLLSEIEGYLKSFEESKPQHINLAIPKIKLIE